VIVEYRSDDNPPPRFHPWLDVASSPGAHYHSFVEHPELIPQVLEDFTPFARWPAVQTFYDLLSWLNGPDSPFETNDCGLRPPRIDHSAPGIIRQRFQSDPLVLHGRLTVLYRDLRLNASMQNVARLKTAIHHALQTVPDFAAAVFIGQWPHLFTAIDTQGLVINLRFWAWGSDEAAVFQSLGSVFESFRDSFPPIATMLQNRQS
jgi:hypothetical protein